MVNIQDGSLLVNLILGNFAISFPVLTRFHLDKKVHNTVIYCAEVCRIRKSWHLRMTMIVWPQNGKRR
jgi:hypothetical protein